MSHLRAHFPERDAYLDRLAQHYADGVLDDAGFEARRDLLMQSTTHGEMLRAFDGLPRPRYVQDGPPARRPGRTRRWLVGGALAVAAAVGLGGLATNPQPTYVGEDSFYGIEVAGDAVGYAVHYDLLDEVHMTLAERGLTDVNELFINAEGLTGTVLSPLAPGEYHTVSKQPERPVVISEAAEGEAQLSADLDQLYNSFFQANEEALWALGGEGYVDQLSLVFTERSTPTVVANVLDLDGVPLGTAQYDLDGNLISLEEHQ